MTRRPARFWRIPRPAVAERNPGSIEARSRGSRCGQAGIGSSSSGSTREMTRPTKSMRHERLCGNATGRGVLVFKKLRGDGDNHLRIPGPQIPQGLVGNGGIGVRCQSKQSGSALGIARPAQHAGCQQPLESWIRAAVRRRGLHERIRGFHNILKTHPPQRLGCRQPLGRVRRSVQCDLLSNAAPLIRRRLPPAR